MATQHQFRMLFVIPAASKASFNTWCRANLNGGIGDDWFSGLGLSPTGNLPATHFWCSAALTPAEAQLAVQRLCTVSGVPIAPTWGTMTKAQKIQWTMDNRAAILAGAGNLRVRAMDNEANWDDAMAELTTAGLKVIQPTIP